MSGEWITVCLRGVDDVVYDNFISRSSSIMAVPSPSDGDRYRISLLSDDWDAFLTLFYEDANSDRISPENVENAIRDGVAYAYFTVSHESQRSQGGHGNDGGSVLTAVLEEVSSFDMVDGSGNAREELRTSGFDEVTVSSESLPSTEVNRKTYGAAPFKTATTKVVEAQLIRDICKIENYNDKLALLTSFLIGTSAGEVLGLRNELVKLINDRFRMMKLLSKQSHRLLLGKVISSTLSSVEDEVNKQLANDKVIELCAELTNVPKEKLIESSKTSVEEYKGLVKRIMGDGLSIVKRLSEIETSIFTLSNMIVSAVSKESEVVMENAKRMIDIISDYPFVTKIDISTDGVFTVYYDDVVMRYNNLAWNLGEFKLCISLKEMKSKNHNSSMYTSSVFEIKNLSVKSQRQHPHVIGDGRSICWGNIKDGIYKLFAEGNLPVIVSLVWNYLHSYNPNDKFVSIEELFREWGRSPLPIEKKGEE